MEGAGIFTALALLLVAPFQWWIQKQEIWARLDELERDLRRCSHSVVLVVFTLAAAFHFYDARGVGLWLAELVTNPGTAWRGSLFVGLIVYGGVRFLLGARRLSGVRDGVRAWAALIKLALGLAVAVYVWRAAWPWVNFGGSGPLAVKIIVGAAAMTGSLWGAIALVGVFLVAAAFALTGAVRFLLVTGFVSSALRAVTVHIRRNQTVMRPAGRHPWWKFWER